jgi:hypothetical protein
MIGAPKPLLTLVAPRQLLARWGGDVFGGEGFGDDPGGGNTVAARYPGGDGRYFQLLLMKLGVHERFMQACRKDKLQAE